MIEGAVDSLPLAAVAKGIQLQTVLNASVGQVLGDAQRLQQIVSNLLSNAIKFTPNGGRVEIRLERRDSQSWIIVSDMLCDIGMPGEDGYTLLRKVRALEAEQGGTDSGDRTDGICQ